MQILKQSTATTIYVGPVLDSAGAAVTTAVVGDFRIVKNGTAATLSGATVTHDANGYYTIALTTGNTDTLGRLTIAVGNTAMAMATHSYTVLLASVFDAIITNATNATGGLLTATAAVTGLSGVIANTTNITTVGAVSGSVGSVSGNVGGNVVGSVGSISGVTFPSNFGSLSITVGGAVTAGTVNDKTGYSLTQAFPANFASLGINASGHISRVVLVDTTTTNTDMRGTDNAALASVWTSTVAGRIDAAISTRSSHSAADVWSVATRTLTAFSFSVTVGTNNDKTGYSLATAPLDASGTAAAVWGALVASYTSNTTFGGRILRTDQASSGNGAKVTGAGHVAADIHELQPAVIQSTHFAAGAIDANALAADAAAEVATAVRTNLATELGRIDATTSSRASQTSVDTLTGYVDTEVAAIKAKTDNLPANPAAVGDIPTTAAIADAVLDELLSGHTIPGSVGTALAAASSAGDPWATILPGSYPAGSAGAIIGAVLAAIDAVPTAAEIDAVLTAAHGSGSWVGAGSTSSSGDISGLSSEIFAAASGPSEVQNGDQKVKARSIAELIEADKHLAAKTAAADPGSIFRRITPPGAR